MKQVLCIESVRYLEEYTLELVFSNGVKKTVSAKPLLWGPVFEPLRDPEYFALVELDEVGGTVAWPNGADIAPEALLELEDVGLTATA